MSERSYAGYRFARILPEVSSTMIAAREAIPELAGESSGGVIAARAQTAGRGRQGRSWSGTGGAFMATYLFPTELSVAQLAGYSLAVGIAIADALGLEHTNLKVKWPNDLVAADLSTGFRKLGGILVELEEADGKRIILVGVGINLQDAPTELPRAGSLAGCCGVSLTLEQTMDILSPALREMHRQFEQFGLSGCIERWSSRSLFAHGDPVEVDTGAEVVSGAFAGVSPNGALTVMVGRTKREVYSGHVVAWNGRALI